MVFSSVKWVKYIDSQFKYFASIGANDSEKKNPLKMEKMYLCKCKEVMFLNFKIDFCEQ